MLQFGEEEELKKAEELCDVVRGERFLGRCKEGLVVSECGVRALFLSLERSEMLPDSLHEGRMGDA